MNAPTDDELAALEADLAAVVDPEPATGEFGPRLYRLLDEPAPKGDTSLVTRAVELVGGPKPGKYPAVNVPEDGPQREYWIPLTNPTAGGPSHAIYTFVEEDAEGVLIYAYSKDLRGPIQ